MEQPITETSTSQVEISPLMIKPSILAPLKDQQLRNLKFVSPLVFLAAYLYTLALLDLKFTYFFPIALLLVSVTEFLAHQLSSPFQTMQQMGANKLETSIFLVSTLAQAGAISFWGSHMQLFFIQFLSLHLSFVFYVLSRNGWLSQGRLGIMIWLDSIQAIFRLPFKNFTLAIRVLLQKYKTLHPEKTSSPAGKKIKQALLLLISTMVAGILVTFAWSQLRQVSDSFATLTASFGQGLEAFFSLLFENLNLSKFLFHIWFALPVTLYLFGLIAGSLLTRKDRSASYQKFHHTIRTLQVFPAFTAYMIIGSLCLTYALFFLTGLGELSHLVSTENLANSISAQDASSLAVSGFWQLVRVSLLNFAVLAAFYLISKKPLWDQKGTRWAATLLFVFASLLALLAGWKLFGLYIFFYGPTPLRLLSAWFVLVLLVWCVLTLIRLHRPIQAIRIGIFYALINFTLLCYLYPLLLF